MKKKLLALVLTGLLGLSTVACGNAAASASTSEKHQKRQRSLLQYVSQL